MESSQILGVRIDHISKNHIRNVIRQKLSEKKFCHIATVNPEFLVTASHNKNFKKILYQTDINICDGIGISIFGKLLYGKKIDRIPGVELAELILREAEKMNKSVFLLGGKGVVDIVEQKICSKYKKIRIVGKIDGDDKTFEVVQKNESRCNFGSIWSS
jgi:N-acetylglucosaminyldiphosphoundecaprenol N-acetyl-beta-D-mannosaminyltransferase